jgi:hypothetical protein
MEQMTSLLPGRGLQLLLMGAAAHEVECEGHVAVPDRRSDAETSATLRNGLPGSRILNGLLLSA